MPNQLNNLASLGRYGDTMLAHINPQEATLLKSMGGAGTINPRTGLREFYDGRAPAPITYQAPAGSYDMRGAPPVASAPFDRSFADVNQLGMGVQKITGYTLPTEQTYADKPLVGKYDSQGNFLFSTMQGSNYLVPDASQPNIISQPRFDASGNVIDWGIVDTNKQDNGSFGSFVRGFASDFGPMILAGLGANLAAGNLGSLFNSGAAAGASSGTGLTLGGGNLGLTGTIGSGLDLAASTGGGLGLTAGSAGAGAIGAGLGTTLAGINTGIGAGGTGLTTIGDTGLTTGNASSGTGIKATTGTGLNLAADTGGGLGVNAATGTGLNLAAATGGGLGLTAGSTGASTIGAGIGDTLAGINTGINTGLTTGINTGIGTGTVTGTGTGTGTGTVTGTGTGTDTSITDVIKKVAGLTDLTGLTGTQLATLLSGLGSVTSGVLSGNAAKDAAQIQADAAIKAAQMQQDMFNTVNAQGAPYRASGYNALNQIGSMLPGQYSKYDANGKLIGTDTGSGYLTQQYGPEQFQKDIDPGYAFRLQQGQMANQRASNLAGGLIGGNALRGMQDYTQGMASQEYGNAFNRFQTQRGNIYNTLAGIAGIGQTAQGQANQLAQNNATAQGQLGVGSAAAQAAGTVGQATGYGSGLTGLGNAYLLSQLLGQNQGVARP